jgi:PST family polysaccharide transporter
VAGLGVAGRGVGVTAIGQGFRFVVTLVSAAVLARLLLPSDFGLLAAVAPVIAFAELIRDLGFAQAIVQRRDVTEHQLTALFCLMLLLTFLLCGVLIGISGIVADFYGDVRIGPILSASTMGIILGAVGSQGLAILNRNLRFSAIAIIDVAQALTNFAVAAVTAALTHSYWALIAGSIAMSAVGAVLSLLLCGWRPAKPKFDGAVLHMVKFGANVSFSNVLNYISRNADNVLIGHAYGAGPLGLYDRAYKLMLLPMWQITYPISRVLVPILSRIDSPKEYTRVYFRGVTFLAVATQPVLVALVCCPHAAVELLLGTRWSMAAPIFGWLGAVAIHQVITSTHGWLYLSQGRAGDYSKVAAFGAVTSVISFAVGLHWGALGVAIAYTLSDYLVRFPFAWLFAGRRGPVTTNSLIHLIAPHVAACLAAVVGVMIISKAFPLSQFLTLSVSIFASYAIYIAVLSGFPSKRALISEVVRGLKKG